MQTMPLLQKALADDWNKLPAVIQRHYMIDIDTHTCIKGNMEIGYPDFLLPLIGLVHLCGGLVAKRGKQISTTVHKSMSPDQTELCWQRRMQYPDNTTVTFCSRMIYLQDKELIEFVRFGFGLKLCVSVENGTLIYCSHGHIWQCGKFRLTFPDWLLLGTAAKIIEQRLSDQQFSLDFSIKHPLWGNSYGYRGVFHYCE